MSVIVRGVELSSLIDIYPPFLMPDFVEIGDNGARSVSSFDSATWWFQSHMPREGAMPGTLMLEAIAQTAVALMANQPVVYGQTPHYLTSAITNFRSRITSDDRELKIVVTPTLHRLGVSKFSGEAKVGSRICVQATLTYFTPDKGVSPAAVQGFVMTDLPK